MPPAAVKRVRMPRRQPREASSDFTKAEASQALRLSRSAIDYAVAQGRLGCIKYGKHVVFTERHLAEFRLLHERGIDPDEKSRLVGIVLQHLDELAAIAAHRDAFCERGKVAA